MFYNGICIGKDVDEDSRIYRKIKASGDGGSLVGVKYI